MKLYLVTLYGSVIGLERLYAIAAVCGAVVLIVALVSWRRAGGAVLRRAALTYIVAFIAVLEIGVRVAFIRHGQYVNLGLGGGIQAVAWIAAEAFVLPLVAMWMVVRASTTH